MVEYSQEVVSEICRRIADGQSVNEIARDETMPAKSTIFLWLATHSEFSDQYARAKEAQAEHMAEDILDIADNANNDWMLRHGDEDAGWQANGEHLQRSRLRIDSRKWLLSKLLPKKYGEKVEHQVGGSLQHEVIQRTIVDPGNSDR